MELLKTLNFEETELKMQKGKGIFEGYASLFNVRDSEGDAFLKGAFTKAINSKQTILRQQSSMKPLLVYQLPALPTWTV